MKLRFCIGGIFCLFSLPAMAGGGLTQWVHHRNGDLVECYPGFYHSVTRDREIMRSGPVGCNGLLGEERPHRRVAR